MNLSELRVKILNGVLSFDCPTCMDHKIRCSLLPRLDSKGRGWSHTGALDKITLVQPIRVGCWEGHVKEGKAIQDAV